MSNYLLYNKCTTCKTWLPKSIVRCPECNKTLRSKPMNNIYRKKWMQSVPRIE